MESKEYFEKVMQGYNQNRSGRSLRKYCKDEAGDYDGLIEFKKTYPTRGSKVSIPENTGFLSLFIRIPCGTTCLASYDTCLKFPDCWQISGNISK